MQRKRRLAERRQQPARSGARPRVEGHEPVPGGAARRRVAALAEGGDAAGRREGGGRARGPLLQLCACTSRSMASQSCRGYFRFRICSSVGSFFSVMLSLPRWTMRSEGTASTEWRGWQKPL
ncbi:unnamed protein product [Prorocentrum cordatum]|uniref:Uncharacterized protein n=1 Tax=Prorocentrum cordatum TaxID=2364126 RepID=A0ABN9V8B0_9DINO|nr:unnamed protein product [Polarella glacialis]